MPKIITSQLQATNTSQVFTLPTTAGSGGVLVTDALGNTSFTDAVAVQSLDATAGVNAATVSAPTVQATTVQATTVSATTLVAPYIKSTPTSATFTLPTAHGAAGSFLQDNGSGVLTFQNVVIALSGTSDPTTATVAAAGIVYMNTTTYEYFVCCGPRVVSGSTVYLWTGSKGTNIGFPQGQQAWTTPGTYSFVVPNFIYSVSAVVVGGGAGAAESWSGGGGGGGALAYATFSVTPGETLTVVVGTGGNGGSGTGINGTSSYIQRSGTTLFSAQGGVFGATSTRSLPVAGSITCYGGQGGLCSPNSYGGGGGAGGYGSNADGSDAKGGDGGYGGSYGPNGGVGANGAGGGGAGYGSSTYSFGGGGGVGLNGRGTSGAAGTYPDGNTWNPLTAGGGGGSGGEKGAGNNNSTLTLNGRTMYGCQGGNCGGGAGGGGTSMPSGGSTYGKGGDGGARIIWGNGRAYPATNTADVTPVE